MPKYNLISPNNENLQPEEIGTLATMLNLPESDYHTAEELCSYFPNDSLTTIKESLSKLSDKGYIICVNGKYAVNKKMITMMKVI